MKISDEAVQAAWVAHDNMLGYSKLERHRAALTAALPFLTGVKVKALDWTEVSEPNEYIRYTHITANSSVGLWSIEWKSWKDYDDKTIHVNGNFIATGGLDLEAAKAAAQDDYEARILSAIEVVPPPRAQALEEAAKIAFDVSENGEYHGEASVDSTSSIYQQGAFEVYEAIRALSSQPVADGPEQSVSRALRPVEVLPASPGASE